MIHSFKASNFYSINEKIEVDFTLKGKIASKVENYHTSSSGTKLSPVEVLIGPNASGKTTALRLVSFIQWLLTESYIHGECITHGRVGIPFETFMLDKKKSSALEVIFEIEDTVYQYGCSFTKKEVLNESLSVKNYAQRRVVDKLLFKRDLDRKKKRYMVKDNFVLDMPQKYMESDALSNTSIIAFAQRLGHKHAKKIVGYWKNVETNIEVSYRHMAISRYHQAYRTMSYYKKNEKARSKAQDTLRQYDLGIKTINSDGDIVHEFGDKTLKLDIFDESSGTQQLLFISKMIDGALDKGSMAIIDEFDAYLHPDMLRVLVDRFLSKTSNPNGAQLLFSSHNLEVLKNLDKQQIILTKKDNENGASIFERLDSQNKARSDDNFHNRYLDDKYGFLPNIKKVG